MAKKNVKKNIKKIVKPKNDKIAKAFDKIKEDIQMLKVILGIVCLIDIVLVLYVLI